MIKAPFQWTKEELVEALITWDRENDNNEGQIYTTQDYANLFQEVYARGIFENTLRSQ